MPNFTESYISKLEPAEKGKRYTVKDDKVKGLICRVTDKGTKTFALYKKYEGRPLRVTIGKHGEITVHTARSRAFEMLVELGRGKNPNTAKQKVRSEMALNQLFDEYIEKHAKKHTRKKTWVEYTNIYKRHLTDWGHRKISRIHRNEIEKRHTELGESSGHYAANGVLKLISQVYNKAIEWGYDGKNPALGIRKYKTKTRDRYVQPNEMSRLFEAIEGLPNEIARDYLFMLIYTGQRKTTVLTMRWDNIHMDRAIWHIPDTKNGDPFVCPLVDEAIEILARRYAERFDNSPWVFPSKTSKSGHFEEPKTAWNRVRENANLKDLRLHDLRRTFGSYQANNGSSLLIIGDSLDHKDPQSTQIYARINLETVRASAQNAIKEVVRLGRKES